MNSFFFLIRQNYFYFSDDADIATILLKNGVDLNAVNMGWKPLHLAAASGIH